MIKETAFRVPTCSSVAPFTTKDLSQRSIADSLFDLEKDLKNVFVPLPGGSYKVSVHLYCTEPVITCLSSVRRARDVPQVLLRCPGDDEDDDDDDNDDDNDDDVQGADRKDNNSGYVPHSLRTHVTAQSDTNGEQIHDSFMVLYNLI